MEKTQRIDAKMLTWNHPPQHYHVFKLYQKSASEATIPIDRLWNKMTRLFRICSATILAKIDLKIEL